MQKHRTRTRNQKKKSDLFVGQNSQSVISIPQKDYFSEVATNLNLSREAAHFVLSSLRNNLRAINKEGKYLLLI